QSPPLYRYAHLPIYPISLGCALPLWTHLCRRHDAGAQRLVVPLPVLRNDLWYFLSLSVSSPFLLLATPLSLLSVLIIVFLPGIGKVEVRGPASGGTKGNW